MKGRICFAGLGVTALAAVWAGCSTGVPGTGTGIMSAASSSSSGAGGATSSSSSAGGSVSSIPFACGGPAAPPSAGDCLITVDAGDDAGTGVQCNPVTNAGCSAGDLCDLSGDSNVVGFICYPGPGSVAVCAACDDETPATTCQAGSSCITYDDAQDSACARYCCTDADCGHAGQCSTVGAGDTNLFGSIAPNLGLCVPK